MTLSRLDCNGQVVGVKGGLDCEMVRRLKEISTMASTSLDDIGWVGAAAIQAKWPLRADMVNCERWCWCGCKGIQEDDRSAARRNDDAVIFPMDRDLIGEEFER